MHVSTESFNHNPSSVGDALFSGNVTSPFGGSLLGGCNKPFGEAIIHLFDLSDWSGLSSLR